MPRTSKALVFSCALAALALGGCSDRYGRVDYLRTGVLGAGLGAGVGLLGAGIAGDQRYRRGYSSYGYGGYGGGYGHRPHGGSYLPPVAVPSYGYGGYGYGRGYGW